MSHSTKFHHFITRMCNSRSNHFRCIGRSSKLLLHSHYEQHHFSLPNQWRQIDTTRSDSLKSVQVCARESTRFPCSHAVIFFNILAPCSGTRSLTIQCPAHGNYSQWCSNFLRERYVGSQSTAASGARQVATNQPHSSRRANQSAPTPNYWLRIGGTPTTTGTTKTLRSDWS